MKLLNKIQQSLKVPKEQYNSFGKYKYRSCEDILLAVKPLLGDSVLTLSDEIKECGGRVFVVATATLVADEISTTTAYAEVPSQRKGMDASQLTGCASSYARKYALNGLFCIDDIKDADANEHNNIEQNDNEGSW